MKWQKQLMAELRGYLCPIHNEYWWVKKGRRESEYIIGCGKLLFSVRLVEFQKRIPLESYFSRLPFRVKEGWIIIDHSKNNRKLVGLTIAHAVGYGHEDTQSNQAIPKSLESEAKAWKYAMQVRKDVPQGAFSYIREYLQSYSHTTWPNTLRLMMAGVARETE